MSVKRGGAWGAGLTPAGPRCVTAGAVHAPLSDEGQVEPLGVGVRAVDPGVVDQPAH